MLKIFSLMFLFLASSAWAQVEPIRGSIGAIESPSEVRIIESSGGLFQAGDLLLIRAQGGDEILGYAEVTLRKGGSESGSGSFAVARVRSHSGNALIRIGDSVESIDLSDSSLSKSQIRQGRHDLVIRGKKGNSAKYKPQVYLGSFTGQTAATLESGEFFLGPGLFAYGINESFQVGTQPFLNALGEANLQVKWQAFQNEDYRVSLGAESRFNFDHRRGSDHLRSEHRFPGKDSGRPSLVLVGVGPLPHRVFASSEGFHKS